MELETVQAPDGLSVYGGPAELPVSPDDAEWALAEGREKLLRNVGEVLLRVLEPGERIRLVSTAFASRKWALPQNSWRRAFDRLAFIATDRRVLLIHVDGKGRPRLYAQQISFSAIRRVHSRLFGFGLVIETGNGVMNIHGMRRKAQDRLVDLVDRNPNATLGWQPLCPSCLKAQESTTGPCTVCGAECKSARTAALRSFIFPGLGEIYLGKTAVGITAAIMMGLVWLILLAVFGMTIAEGGLEPSAIFALVLVGALMFVLGHGVSAAFAHSHARRSRFSPDFRLPSGVSGQAEPSALLIVPAGEARPEATAALAAAAAKKEPPWSRFGRPVLGALGGLLVFLGVIVAFAIVDQWAASEVPLEEADYRFLPTADDLGEWLDDFEASSEHVTASKTIYTDGSYSIDYEYDEPDSIFFQSSVNVERKASDALTVYGGGRVSYQASYAALTEDIELEDADDFFQWGDRSMHVFLTSGGETFGQIFMAQQGRIVFSVTISGVYFDQSEDFEEFLLPYLEQIAQLASQPHQRPKG